LVIESTPSAAYHQTRLELIHNSSRINALISSALIALLLSSSAISYAPVRRELPAQTDGRIALAMKSYSAGEFQTARALFQAIAIDSHKAGAERAAAMNWNNAGGCSLALMQYGTALADFTRAEKIAQSSKQTEALASTLNNLASLYLHTGQTQNAMAVATEGLNLPPAQIKPDIRAKTRFQLAYALMQLNRFDEAEPIYLLSINELMDVSDLDTAARELGLFGDELVRGNRLTEAEWALSEGLWLVRIHRLEGSGNILRGLAKLRSAQGDVTAAARLFDAALAAPPSFTPRWGIFMDRGQFRLKQGNFESALADFREARRIAFQVRADMVPADQDRVSMEGGLSGVMEGLVEAGNRLAEQTGDASLLRDTFDAAEQDRLWSLRALLPTADDWRTRLPEHYWELLARYQSLQRAFINGRSPAIETKAAPLKLEMQQIEAGAAGVESLPSGVGISPIAHVQNTLDADSVLLSFHVTKASSWVWAVDREHIGVFRLPPMPVLHDEVTQFAAAITSGNPAEEAGRGLYRSLFGQVPVSYLVHKHWLLEPDGPLYELPFAALVAGGDEKAPVYLIERAALQSIPSALLMEHGSVRPDGEFLGIGDPVYNMADARFRGKRNEAELMLPRLPNTMEELEACARAWNPARSRLLNGNAARIGTVQSAIKKSPAIIHFATHVVSSGEEFRSGLIALSLGTDGAMGLLGPKEIVARPVDGSVVVMDGCHSSQGAALPSAGLMGLSRAWIGAGARAVMATHWDVPDEAAQLVMTTFYRSLNNDPDAGLAFALRAAQIAEIQRDNSRHSPKKWAGYSLLSRM
jgi:tetratricopeptide (TPR) repeat protein